MPSLPVCLMLSYEMVIDLVAMICSVDRMMMKLRNDLDITITMTRQVQLPAFESLSEPLLLYL